MKNSIKKGDRVQKGMEVGEAECMDFFDYELLDPLPGEENSILRPPRFWRQHDSLRIAKHRRAEAKRTLHVKKIIGALQREKVGGLPMKQETDLKSNHSQPVRTGGFPIARQSRTASRKVVRKQQENQSQYIL